MEQEELSLLFKALSHPARREILDLLKGEPMSTNEICERFEVSRFQVMKHLDILEEAHLVLVRRQGRAICSRLRSISKGDWHRWQRKRIRLRSRWK